MTVLSFLKKLVKSSFLDGLEHAVKGTLEDAEHRAEEVIDHAEKRATIFMHNMLKGTILLFLGTIGFVFTLVGLATYLTQSIPSMSRGVGFIVIGGILFLMVVFAKFIQREK
jgi:hypothetical protein